MTSETKSRFDILEGVSKVVGFYIGYVRANIWEPYKHLEPSHFVETCLKFRQCQPRDKKLIENLAIPVQTNRINRFGKRQDVMIMPHGVNTENDYHRRVKNRQFEVEEAKRLLTTLITSPMNSVYYKEQVFREVEYLLFSGHDENYYQVRHPLKSNHGMLFYDTVSRAHQIGRVMGLESFDAYSLATIASRRLHWNKAVHDEIFITSFSRQNAAKRMHDLAEKENLITNVAINSLLSLDNNLKLLPLSQVPAPTQCVVEYHHNGWGWVYHQTWTCRKDGSFVKEYLTNESRNQLEIVTYASLIEHIDDPNHPWTWHRFVGGNTYTCRIIRDDVRNKIAMVKITVIPDYLSLPKRRLCA